MLFLEGNLNKFFFLPNFFFNSDAWADRLNVIPNNTEAVALGAITVRINIIFFLFEKNFIFVNRLKLVHYVYLVLNNIFVDYMYIIILEMFGFENIGKKNLVVH